MGQKWDKNTFTKSEPRPFGMLKQVFLARFEPVVTHFGQWKIPKCPENGPFWDQEWVKKWLQNVFFLSDLGQFGMLKQVFLAHLEPVVTRFGPCKIPKCLEKGPFWDQKWVKNGTKTRLPKVNLDHLGCSNKCF